MKLKFIIYSILWFTLLSCKKLDIETTKYYVQKDFISDNPMNNGLSLTLHPDKTADLLIMGDIMVKANYRQNGGKIIVTTRDGDKYEFKIISKTELEEKEYGTRLELRPNS